MASKPYVNAEDRMPVESALQVLCSVRHKSDVVITNQGSARLWPRLSQQAGDFNYNPSTMGGAIPWGLGVALACPSRHVIVLSGDGSLLMNLGSLVTVIDSRVSNLTIVLLENGLYEVTGGQATAARGSSTNFAAVARGVGFGSVTQFHCARAWQSQAAETLAQPGPRFVALRVAPLATDCLDDVTQPINEQLQRLKDFLVES